MCLLIISFQQNTNRACRRQTPKCGDISTLLKHWMDTEKLKKDSWKSWVCFVPCSLQDFIFWICDQVSWQINPQGYQGKISPNLSWDLGRAPATAADILSDVGQAATTDPTCLLICQTGMWKLPHSTMLCQMCCWTSCVYVCEENIGWKALQKCKIWFVMI